MANWEQDMRRLSQEVFPYFGEARQYLHVLSEAERDCFRRRSLIAWLWHHCGGGFTTYRATRRLLKWLRERMRR